MNRMLFPTGLALLFSLLHAASLGAQEKLAIQRVKGIPLSCQVLNISVDAENTKWISTDRGLFQLRSPETGTELPPSDGKSVVFQFPGGNSSLAFSPDEMARLGGISLDEENPITAAAYDAVRDLLWIGTAGSGALAFKTKPRLTLEHKMNTNAKGGSEKVNCLFLESSGQTWIGTDNGVFYGTPGKWKQEQKYYTIQSVVKDASTIWVLGDDLLWKVSGGNWEPIEIPAKLSDGTITAMAADADGRLWLASEVIARFDPQTAESILLGPADYYTTQFPTCIAIDLDGAAWVGSRDKGAFVVDKASAWRLELVLQQPFDCNSEKGNAAINAVVSGGNPPFSYSWNTGQKSPSLSGLNPGKYAITVLDATGNQKTAELTLEDTRIQSSARATKEESARNMKDGQAAASATGGYPPYTFSWDNGEKNAQAQSLTGGNHQVTVTDSKGCKSIAQVAVARKDDPISLQTIRIKGVSCPEEKDGAFEIALSGGSPPLQVKWSTPGLQGTQSSGLRAGKYPLSVTDSKGVSLDTFIEIPAPQVLSLRIQAEKPCSLNAADGQALAIASGGTIPYNFTWDNGEKTERAVALAAGNRQATVIDANGCRAEAKIIVSENILPLQVTLTQMGTIKCSGENQAALQANVSGGKPPFKYQWSNGTLSGDKANGLKAGTYRLSVQDAAGNTSNTEITIPEPAPLELSTEILAAASTNKSDGKARATARGGTAPYAFTWDTRETNENAILLPAGMRKITVVDANGCSTSAQVEMKENILPISLFLSVSKEIKCQGKAEGALALSIRGGKSPFSILWNIPGTSGENPVNLKAGKYEVTVTDVTGTKATQQIELKEPPRLEASATLVQMADTDQANGKAKVVFSGGSPGYTFAWSNGANGLENEQLAAGKFTVTVTDNNGCSANASVEITEAIQPLAAQIITDKPIGCQGQKNAQLSVEVSGGKKPYTYSWSNGTKAMTLSQLGPGTYKVTVSDAKGNSVTRETTLQEPLPFKVVSRYVIGAGAKADGEAHLQASGGTAPYQYLWDNQEAEATARLLSSGTHQVTVTDQGGCMETLTLEVPGRIIEGLYPTNVKKDVIIQLEQVRFDVDSTNFNPKSIPALDEIVHFLQAFPQLSIEIGGHTSSLCSDEFCDKLSAARANSVAMYLMRKGIEQTRVSSVGYGKRNPIAPNNTAEGRQKNQRVELKILETGNP